MIGFCFDTSALIECWSRTYPPDVVPGLWDQMSKAASHRSILSPEEVRHEVQRQDDGLYEWLNSRSYMFVPLDEPIQLEVRNVLRQHPLLMKATKNRNGADPFVIATAKVMGLTVVTEEIGGTEQRPKIPSVCTTLGVPCINTLQFIRERGWTFS